METLWIIPAFMSAALLGLYDACKKYALKTNDVVPVLFINTLLCSLIFLPLILLSATGNIAESSSLYIPTPLWHSHKYILLKSAIVLSSWIFGYLAMKHLPLTIVGPINATRPVMTIIGALLIFGETLNLWQWAGVTLGIISFFLLSVTGRKEGIRFSHNRWIYFLVCAAILGAASGLYDKYLMSAPIAGGVGLNRLEVQSWYNIYQCAMMAIIAIILWWPRRHSAPVTRLGAVAMISIFLTGADLCYFYALSLPDSMVSIVSMVRRGSVIVSFLCGALIFHEKNLRAKSFDLLLVLIGLILLFIGSR